MRFLLLLLARLTSGTPVVPTIMNLQATNEPVLELSAIDGGILHLQARA